MIPPPDGVYGTGSVVIDIEKAERLRRMADVLERDAWQHPDPAIGMESLRRAARWRVEAEAIYARAVAS